jgi:hypothetical protein
MFESPDMPIKPGLHFPHVFAVVLQSSRFRLTQNVLLTLVQSTAFKTLATALITRLTAFVSLFANADSKLLRSEVCNPDVFVYGSTWINRYKDAEQL